MLSEMEDSAWAQRIADVRYANQLQKRIRRQNEQLARRRSEISREITAQHLADSNLEAIYKIEDTLTEFESLTETERNWFQKIVDWIKELMASLKGVEHERTVPLCHNLKI